MSTTLTNGLKLPDKGSVDWYADMQNNYTILDGAVGTVAEHTTQIAGKAPLVHTHTKSDITDFPAYGTTAGTICEGNDSRLSDARTPVAHTHTKSDVTDLLNSNFIPSANNSYDLGSSSFQWNNLYAKNYYYNGTAWGLDKANEWTNDNTYKGSNLNLQNNLKEIGSSSSQGHYTIRFKDKNGVDMGFISHQTTFLRIGLSNKFTNGVYDPSGTQINNYLNLYVNSDGTKSADIYSDFVPAITQRYNLGNSTFKWATFNGINPGALSLPNLTAKIYDPNNGWYDLDTTDWDLTGSPIDISSSVLKDGYVYVCLACDSTGYVIICEGAFGYPNCYYSASGLPISGYARALLPVRRGTDVRLYLKGTSVYGARLFPALGNV